MLPNISLKKLIDAFLLCLLVIIYNSVCKHFENVDNFRKTSDGARTVVPANPPFFSSVWCQGSNHTDRQCRFTNLCYSSKEKEFMFFKSHQSIISGVPSNLFDPALAELSSVDNHNKMFFNYVEYPFDIFSKFQVSTIQGCAIIVKRFNPDNLMHVFHDDLLPIFYKLKESIWHLYSGICENLILVFADDRLPGPYFMLYNTFLETEPIYLTDIRNDICFENSFIGLNKQTTWYQYGFKIPQGSLIKNFDGMTNIIHQFTEYFKQRLKLPLQRHDCAVFFVRKINRKILNEEEVIEAIKQNLYKEVHVLGLESHSIIEIIEYLSNCKSVIGIHGSLLILSMFLLPGSSLIELFPYAISPKYYTPYKTLTGFPGIGISYYSWENKNKANSRPHPDNIPDLGGIKHLPIDRQNHIKNLSFVHPPLCCGNPEWLYHIYQDTIVNIPSFTKVIKSARNTTECFDEIEYKNSEVERLQKSIKPSAVKDLLCSRHFQFPNTFTISWSEPSNLPFINHTKLEYEIWLQLSGQDDVAAYIIKKPYFTVTEAENVFFIWIRCWIDGDNYGPFNDDGFLCFPDIQ